MMKVETMVANKLDKVDDLDYEPLDLEIKPFNSGESFRCMRPQNHRRFLKNRQTYYEMRSFLAGVGRD